MINVLTSCFTLLFLFYSCSKSTAPSDSEPKRISVDSSYFTGNWSGDLYYDHYHLSLGFHLAPKKSTINNPAQSLAAQPADSMRFEASMVTIYTGKVKFELTAVNADEMAATLVDGEERRAFTLYRNREISPLHRPQTPSSKPTYRKTSITFKNDIANISLSGTLTLPAKPPGSFAILLTGSGPQDRDETILQHKPFAVIADFLTTAGMGVLRYDDRGVGESEGAHSSATTFDFARDAAAAYNYLSLAYPKSPIGFIGHSEGGMIAQIADSLVGGASYHIYLASPGLEITELMKEQNELVLKESLSPETLQTYVSGLGPIYETIISEKPIGEKQTKLNELTQSLYRSLDKEDAQKLAPSEMIFSMSFSQVLYLKWWPYFLAYKPKQYLSQITCPILALNGEKDIQVSPRNLQAIKDAASQSQVSTITLKNTNHLFQRCASCTIGEYGMLTESFSPDALELMKTWMRQKGFLH